MKKQGIILNIVFMTLAIVNATFFVVEHNYEAAIGWGLAAMWCFNLTLHEYDEL